MQVVKISVLNALNSQVALCYLQVVAMVLMSREMREHLVNFETNRT